MMPKGMIKVICIVMAALMILSVVAVVLQVVAVDDSFISLATPVTGDNDSDYIIPAGLGVAGLLAIVLCLVLPKLKKK